MSSSQDFFQRQNKLFLFRRELSARKIRSGFNKNFYGLLQRDGSRDPNREECRRIRCRCRRRLVPPWRSSSLPQTRRSGRAAAARRVRARAPLLITRTVGREIWAAVCRSLRKTRSPRCWLKAELWELNLAQRWIQTCHCLTKCRYSGRTSWRLRCTFPPPPGKMTIRIR